MNQSFGTRSTSLHSAACEPIVLRTSDQRQLVFHPEIVENPNDRTATVRGRFVYQRKRKADEWEDIRELDLSRLKAGEGYQLELKAGEVLALTDHLSNLYDIAIKHGIPMGSKAWTVLPASELIDQVGRALGQEGDNAVRAQLLTTFLAWSSLLDPRELIEQLAPADINDLVTFDAAIAHVRLTKFVERAEEMLDGSSEAHWQQWLREQSWAISHLFSAPTVMIGEQVYVGGKSVMNRDGNTADFLFANNLTGNVLVVEIKEPGVALMVPTPYRNNIHSIAREVAGGVGQVLHQRHSLQQNWLALAASIATTPLRAENPRGLLIVGRADTLPIDPLRSFELFRSSLVGLDVIAFDELVAKARAMLELFALH